MVKTKKKWNSACKGVSKVSGNSYTRLTLPGLQELRDRHIKGIPSDLTSSKVCLVKLAPGLGPRAALVSQRACTRRPPRQGGSAPPRPAPPLRAVIYSSPANQTAQRNHKKGQSRSGEMSSSLRPRDRARQSLPLPPTSQVPHCYFCTSTGGGCGCFRLPQLNFTYRPVSSQLGHCSWL